MYTNLKQLLANSSSTRKYFLSLPVDMQLKLHKFNSCIHTAQQLHSYQVMLQNGVYNDNCSKSADNIL